MPRPERSFRTPALILKRHDFGESDRLLTLLTPDHGKISGVAKGARKMISKKTGHVELFTRVDMLLSRGRSDLYIVTQAEVVAPFIALREDLERGSYANYIAELTDRFLADADADGRGVFDLLSAAFGWLNDDDDLRLAVRYFELHLLDHAGFRPQLDDCVFTQEPLLPVDQHFSYSEGGVASPMAAQFAASLVPLPVTLFKLLRYIQRSPYHQVRALNISESLHAQAEHFMLDYLVYLLESRLRSVDFIRRIRGLR